MFKIEAFGTMKRSVTKSGAFLKLPLKPVSSTVCTSKAPWLIKSMVVGGAIIISSG